MELPLASRPGDDADESPPGHLRVRTVWISDLHLGTPGCQAGALLAFLKHVECETLYLVGDIIDGWQLRRAWYWPQVHNDVVQKLLRKARKGTRVIFVPGNHDEFARKYVQHNFGGIEVVDEWIHETADGRRLWVIHGDLFDGVIQCAKWLGDWVESLTALIEHADGRLEIFDWSQRAAQRSVEARPAAQGHAPARPAAPVPAV
ncbi:MAG: metallophosphoesterase [Pseudomonadota bacterium]